MINEPDLLFGGLTILGVIGMLFIGFVYLNPEAPAPKYNDSRWLSDNPEYKNMYDTYNCTGITETREDGYMYCLEGE